MLPEFNLDSDVLVLFSPLYQSVAARICRYPSWAGSDIEFDMERTFAQLQLKPCDFGLATILRAQSADA